MVARDRVRGTPCAESVGIGVVVAGLVQVELGDVRVDDLTTEGVVEEDGQRPVLVVERVGETTHDVRKGLPQHDLVLIVDHAVAVLVDVFDHARTGLDVERILDPDGFVSVDFVPAFVNRGLVTLDDAQRLSDFQKGDVLVHSVAHVVEHDVVVASQVGDRTFVPADVEVGVPAEIAVLDVAGVDLELDALVVDVADIG